jgi:hypothetical protein
VTSVVFPNAMWDLRYWLRNHPNLAPIHGGRCFFRLPDFPVSPLMRLYRAGGGVQSDSEVPMQDLRAAIEIWGMTDPTSGRSDYTPLTNLQMGLEDACTNVQPGMLINPSGNTLIHNANFTTGFDSPDPDTGWPRIVCDVTFTVTAKVPSTY